MTSLVRRILAGDSQAVEIFYEQYSPRLLNFLKQKLPRPEDAQEVLNDVFLDAIDGLPTLSRAANLQAWLYAIARHNVGDFYRKRKIKSLLLSQFPYLEIVAAEVNQPEFQLEKQELKKHLQETFAKLSVKYRQILEMHYIEEMSVKMISLRLDLSFKATESLLYRARLQFIKYYEGS